MPIWIRTLQIFVFVTLILTSPVRAQDVWITEDLPFFEFEAGGEFFLIERDQDSEARIIDAFSKTSRACPPFCIQPMILADGVQTVGEVELLDFIQDYVEPGQGFLIDARVESFFLAGTIPGAVNLPFNMFVASATNPFLNQLMTLLGGVSDGVSGWDFENAAQLMLFCNGPWCAQSTHAINNLLELGYPAERLFYYRGGMQSWTSLGLTIVTPE